MKVLLIHPPLTGEERYGKFQEVGSYLPPLGICYIAAVLEKNGIQVKIIDGLGEKLSIDRICEITRRYDPDYIGITMASIAYHNAVELAKAFKKEIEHVPIIVGGPHVSIFQEKALDSQYFDFGVLGEGEVTFLELIKTISKRDDLGRVKGILYRKNNKVLKTAPRPFINNLDELPFPARHFLPPLQTYKTTAMVYKRLPVTSMISSRGCPYKCIFCNRIFGRHYRFNSAEYVVEEMEMLAKDYGIKEITFYEDDFTVNRTRVLEICDLIKGKRLDVTWSCLANINSLTPEMLVAMKEAGCWLISIGIESGDEEVLRFIKKNLSLEKVKQITKWADKIGMQMRGYFIIGHPIDTKERIKRTINFAKSLPLHTVNFCLQYLVPGSELYQIAPKYGETNYDFRMITGHSSGNELPFVPYGLTKEYIFHAQERAYREFYLRTTQLLRMIKTIDSWNDCKKYLSMFKTFLRISF